MFSRADPAAARQRVRVVRPQHARDRLAGVSGVPPRYYGGIGGLAG